MPMGDCPWGTVSRSVGSLELLHRGDEGKSALLHRLDHRLDASLRWVLAIPAEGLEVKRTVKL